MPLKNKVALTLQYNSEEKPLSGVGPGVGHEFIKAYFPEARNSIRIASAYFTLRGYKLGRESTGADVQIQILVGREEGENVQTAVIDEILSDLGQCETDLWKTVFELVERMKRGQFLIRDAREMQTKFHCKFYICDDQIIWHGSANYTGLGLRTNAEQASVSRDPDQIRQFTQWYDDVSKNAKDLLIELIARLEKWLELASPFEVYLKTLLLLNNLPDHLARPGAHQPVYYQKGVIARALRQAEDYGGVLIVAATGLGKTIMGAEIAMRLQAAGKIKRVILISPDGVRENWEDQFEGRDIYPKYFNIGVLFRRAMGQSRHQADQLEKQLRRADHETAILIDEAHFYRNQLLSEKSKHRKSLVYQRLGLAVKAGAKIFLLTATVYGTNLQNLNSLLYLLPHRRPTLFDTESPWAARDEQAFVNLPVITILGLPHVLKMARDRGDIDDEGRTFIQLAGERHYLPAKLSLHTVRYRLYLQDELQVAFDRRCFDQAYKFQQPWYDDEKNAVRQGLIDTVYNSSLMSWLSSPAAMAYSLEQNLKTLGDTDEVNSKVDSTPSANAEIVTPQINFWGQPATGRRGRRRTKAGRHNSSGHGHNAPMHLSYVEREALLRPLLDQLSQPEVNSDDKFQKLKAILESRCVRGGGKVIIFVKRHVTALYLLEVLDIIFDSRLSIGCTVEGDEDNPRLMAGRERSEVLKRFSPRSHNFDADQPYNILICTDADGVGVNLQDADTVVNYDPPEGSDVLFQRAGRVLRMTNDSERVVHFYTLIPMLAEETNSRSKAQNSIHEIFSRITHRHARSQRILGSSVLSSEAELDIPLDGELDVEQLTRDSQSLKEIGGLGAEAMMAHTAVLEQYRSRAESLPPYLLSARNYWGTYPGMFVLLQHGEVYRPIVFNLAKQRLEVLGDLELLDLIACSETEPRAVVPPETIERIANRVTQAWCVAENIPIEQVRKICALYLMPASQNRELENLFTSFEENPEE